jgi:hypothetical protein
MLHRAGAAQSTTWAACFGILGFSAHITIFTSEEKAIMG